MPCQMSQHSEAQAVDTVGRAHMIHNIFKNLLDEQTFVMIEASLWFLLLGNHHQQPN